MTESGHDASGKLSGDEALIAAARRELDGSCRALDGHTLSRLNSIRHAALERKTSPSRGLLPFGGLVTACVLVLAIGLNGPARSPEADVQAGSSPIEDIELLSSDENLDLLEDYDFYQWLADNGSAI